MSLTPVAVIAPAVRFEPCLEFRVDLDDAGVCDGCGWTADEHDRPPLAA
jgi:hypothetical protein